MVCVCLERRGKPALIKGEVSIGHIRDLYLLREGGRNPVHPVTPLQKYIVLCSHIYLYILVIFQARSSYSSR